MVRPTPCAPLRLHLRLGGHGPPDHCSARDLHDLDRMSVTQGSATSARTLHALVGDAAIKERDDNGGDREMHPDHRDTVAGTDSGAAQRRAQRCEECDRSDRDPRSAGIRGGSFEDCQHPPASEAADRAGHRDERGGQLLRL